ncbi:MAG: DUF2332 domain-containing protein [Kineosporiaceae bacterium]
MPLGPHAQPSAITPLDAQFLQHAAWCDEHGAPLYGELMRGLADGWRDGGVVRRLCAPFDGTSPGHAVQLRVLGALHRLVLRGQAPDLAPFCPSVGGTSEPAGAWEVAAALLAEHEDWVRTEIRLPPQTNEVGRASALAVLLAAACARTGLPDVRLLEIGASAGLNLGVAGFRITGDSFTWGPADAPVRMDGAVRDVPADVAALAGRVRVTSAQGCDLDPVDATSATGQEWLLSFVWPDHVERFTRLRAALAQAAARPPAVERAEAGSWLARRLTEPAPAGVLTVVWHSVMQQYVPDEAWRRIEHEIDAARARMPLAHVALEPVVLADPRGHGLWLDGEVVGHAQPHGVPTFWGAW